MNDNEVRNVLLHINLNPDQPSLSIPITFGNGQILEGLIDTGSDISLISHNIAKSFNLKPLPSDPIKLTFGNSSSVLCVMKVVTDITFLSKNMKSSFYVSQTCPVPLLLGMDFIRESCLVIKVNDHSATIESHLMDRKVMMVNHEKPDEKVYPVMLYSDNVLIPYSTNKITVQCPYIGTGTVIMDPDILFIRRKDLEVVPSLLSIERNCCQIIIINPNSYPVYIQRNAIVGFVDFSVEEKFCNFVELLNFPDQETKLEYGIKNADQDNGGTTSEGNEKEELDTDSIPFNIPSNMDIESKNKLLEFLNLY